MDPAFITINERAFVPGQPMFQWACACDNRGPWTAVREIAESGAAQHLRRSGWHNRWLMEQQIRGDAR